MLRKLVHERLYDPICGAVLVPFAGLCELRREDARDEEVHGVSGIGAFNLEEPLSAGTGELVDTCVVRDLLHGLRQHSLDGSELLEEPSTKQLLSCRTTPCRRTE